MSQYLKISDQIVSAEIKSRKPHLILTINHRDIVVQNFQTNYAGEGTMTLNGQELSFLTGQQQDNIHVHIDGRNLEVKLLGHSATVTENTETGDQVVAPMPGLIIDISCAEGQSVKQGDILVTIESMKLQTELSAPRAGTISQICFVEGATFERDACLIALEPELVETPAE
ncbi:MAG: biotin/lipoyl-containing protein [Sneathiella sp.]